MTNWEYVKEFYKTHFGIDEWVIELYANLDILQLCASGASNKSIVEFCDLEEDDVVEILMNTFKFPGWKIDLPINPYKVFSNVGESEEAFHKEIKDSNIFELKTITDVYKLCKTMKDIEERIADEWI